MSSKESKDNTCPACGGKGYYINGIDPRTNTTCTACQGSGQQEDKPTKLCANDFCRKPLTSPMTWTGHGGEYCSKACKDGTWPTDSKPEKPHDYGNNGWGAICLQCGHIKTNHGWPPYCPGKEKPPMNELGEILTKFSPDLTDVQHIKLMQAIEALISQREVEVLEAVRRGWPVDSPEYPYMSSTIDRYINERRRSNG